MRVGDAVASMTAAVGMVPCSGCKRRAEALNRMFDAAAPEQPEFRVTRDVGAASAERLAASLLLGAVSLALRRRLRRP